VCTTNEAERKVFFDIQKVTTEGLTEMNGAHCQQQAENFFCKTFSLEIFFTNKSLNP
jgi:hypothetical protein